MQWGVDTTPHFQFAHRRDMLKFEKPSVSFPMLYKRRKR